MLKAVVDKNVIVSGAIRKSGPPFAIVSAWRDGQFILVTSRSLILEVAKVLNYPKIKKKYALREDQIEKAVKNLENYSVITPGRLSVRVIKEDPDDDMIIQAALEGEAEYIVSGDRHLKALRDYHGIQIVSPTAFLRILKSHHS